SRKSAVALAWRIRRMRISACCARLCIGIRAPAFGIGCREAVEVLEGLDLPHAGVLHVAHVVDTFGPVAVATAVTPEHRERAPASLRRLPAGLKMHNRLHVDVVVEASVTKTDFTHRNTTHVAI